MNVWTANKLMKYLIYAIIIMLTAVLISIVASLFESGVELHKKMIGGIMIPATILFQIFLYQATKSMDEEE